VRLADEREIRDIVSLDDADWQSENRKLCRGLPGVQDTTADTSEKQLPGCVCWGIEERVVEALTKRFLRSPR